MASTGSFFEIPDPPRFKDARLAALYGYWHELGEEARGLPSIQAFDALRVPRILANIWIVEVVPDNRRFRIRLAGDNINAVYGRNVGGQFFRDVFEPGDLPNIIDRYTRALSEPSIFYATGSVYAAAGRLSSGSGWACRCWAARGSPTLCWARLAMVSASRAKAVCCSPAT